MALSEITLFDAAAQVRVALELTDPETGELDESWSGNVELFKQKAVACVAYAKDEANRLDASEAMLKKMAEQLASKRKRLARFQHYMEECMRNSGVLQVQDDSGLFRAKLELGRDEVVEIDQGATFPDELCLKPIVPKPSKKLIGDAIKRGEPIKGARIVRKDRFSIT